MGVTHDALLVAVGKLMAMPFYPGDELVKVALMTELPEIVEDDEQLVWLIGRVTRVFKAWPGLSEIRAVYCTRFKPRDGIEVYSGVYPDGIPPERPVVQPALPPKRETKGLTADPELDQEIQRVAKLKKLPGRAR